MVTDEDLAADREMDEQIATRIMGWRVYWLWTAPDWESGIDKVCTGCRNELDPLGPDPLGPDPLDDLFPGIDWHSRHEQRLPCYRDEDGLWAVVPAFSEDMTDAWAVVEELRDKRGCDCECGTAPEGRWYCVVSNNSEHVYGFANAETMPLAICRAALKAVEEQHAD